jgi:hypothetical protein
MTTGCSCGIGRGSGSGRVPREMPICKCSYAESEAHNCSTSAINALTAERAERGKTRTSSEKPEFILSTGKAPAKRTKASDRSPPAQCNVTTMCEAVLMWSNVQAQAQPGETATNAKGSRSGCCLERIVGPLARIHKKCYKRYVRFIVGVFACIEYAFHIQPTPLKTVVRMLHCFRSDRLDKIIQLKKQQQRPTASMQTSTTTLGYMFYQARQQRSRLSMESGQKRSILPHSLTSNPYRQW